MDKFNDIWKNRFNDGDIPSGDWNMPDDEVWGNIMSEVPVKDDRRKLVFWIFGSSLMALLILSYFSFFENTKTGISEIKPINQEIENSKGLIQDQDNALKNIEPQANENNNTESSKLDDKILPEAKLDLLTIEQNVKSSPDLVKERKGSDNKIPSISSTTVTSANGSTIEFNTIAKDYISLSSNEGEEVGRPQAAKSGVPVVNSIDKKDDLKSKSKEADVSRILGDLSLLPMYVFEMNIKEEEYPMPKDAKINIQNFSKKSKLRLGVEVGAVLWQHKISDQYQSDLAPFDFNYSDDIGWYSSLNVEIPANNFVAFFGGVQYEQIETTSGHNSALAYDVNSENINQSNDYDLSLATPYGLSEASFRFNRNEAILGDEIDLLVDFNSRHRIQNLSIPIGVKIFPTGQRKRIVPVVSVGMGTNYLVSISNDIHSIDTHHDAIQYKRDGSSSFQSPDLKQLHFDFRLGLGFGYNITRDIQASINANWSKGLNPIFEQNNYKTSINRYHLSLGLNYKLR